jgi:hypothetical protein
MLGEQEQRCLDDTPAGLGHAQVQGIDGQDER